MEAVMWFKRKKEELSPGAIVILDDHTLHPDTTRIFLPLETMAVLASLSAKQFDDLVLVGNGLRACCETQNFDMPQPILDALLRILKCTQQHAYVLKIILEENGVKDKEG